MASVKLLKLCHLLINSYIAVLAVQEFKLRKAVKTSFVEGQTIIQKGRNNIFGGERLIFIRTNIVFEKLHSFEKAGMEALFIRLKTTKSTWLKLYNISTQYNYPAKLLQYFTNQTFIDFNFSGQL